MTGPTVYFAADALKPQPPQVWVVENLVSPGSFSLVVGAGGDGKTYSMMAMGAHVAQGSNFGSRKTIQGPVLFVDEESGKVRFDRRLGNVMRGIGADDSLPFFYTSLNLFDLRKKKDLQELEKVITGYGVTLVVIDALIDVMPGADENASKDIAPILQGLRSIAERTKAAIIVIHHMNRGGSYRGSTALKGAVDLMLYVEKKGNKITFTSEKSRDTEPFEFSMEVHFGTDTFTMTEIGKSAAKPYDEMLRKLGRGEISVLKFIAQNGEASKSDIEMNAAGCTPKTAKNALYSQNLQTYIERQNGGGSGSAAFYGLTTEGVRLAVFSKWVNDPWLSAEHCDVQ